MKRRRFLQAIAASSAVPALLAQGGPAGLQAEREIPELQVTAAETIADAAPRFFTGQQFVTLHKLSDTVMPPMYGNPGALDAGVPAFLDFLIGVSPAETQQLYQRGLIALEGNARRQHGRSFAELGAPEVEAILQPLLVPWTYDPPSDPLEHFFRQAQEDIETATVNSREWAEASAQSGSRGGRRGRYVEPIDPIQRI